MVRFGCFRLHGGCDIEWLKGRRAGPGRVRRGPQSPQWVWLRAHRPGAAWSPTLGKQPVLMLPELHRTPVPLGLESLSHDKVVAGLLGVLPSCFFKLGFCLALTTVYIHGRKLRDCRKHKIPGKLMVQSKSPCREVDFLNRRLLGWQQTWFSNPKGALLDREGLANRCGVVLCRLGSRCFEIRDLRKQCLTAGVPRSYVLPLCQHLVQPRLLVPQVLPAAQGPPCERWVEWRPPLRPAARASQSDHGP